MAFNFQIFGTKYDNDRVIDRVKIDTIQVPQAKSIAMLAANDPIDEYFEYVMDVVEPEYQWVFLEAIYQIDQLKAEGYKITVELL